MGGTLMNKGAPTLTALAKMIEKELKHAGFYLDSDITIQSREQIESDKKLTKLRKKLAGIPNPVTDIYEDQNNKWFAVFHMHT